MFVLTKAVIIFTLLGSSFFISEVQASANHHDQVMALQVLADEYAARHDALSLTAALKALDAFRESDEFVKDATQKDVVVPDVNSASLLVEVAKARLAIQQILSGEALDQITSGAAKEVWAEGAPATLAAARVGYDHDFNGSTLGPREVVVTFDDGPHKRLTPLVHEFVKKLNVPAAFFEVGENVEASPDITKALADDGFVVANHSYNHPNMAKLSDAVAKNQIDRTQKIILSAVGGVDSFEKYFQLFFQNLFSYHREVYAPEFFRTPYGSRSARIMKLITNTKVSDLPTGVGRLNHILWTVDSLDWSDHSPSGIERRVFNQLATFGHHGVILFHDIHPQTYVAIQTILPRLQREGYKLISLYEMLKEIEVSQPTVIPTL